MTWLPTLLVAILAATLTGFVWRAQRLRSSLARQIAAAERILGKMTAGSLSARAEQAIIGLLAHAANGAARSAQVHPVTGLATREVLFKRMISDNAGTLIVLVCRDYDRLCTFDPALAERVLLAIVKRLHAMLPASRLIAQVDRAHLAIWLGPEVSEAAAAAEAQAVRYALSDRLVDADRQILPEIALRSARFDAAQGTPQAAVSWVISSFAVPLTAPGDQPLDDTDLAARTQDQFALEQDLRQAIARGELHMEFQPLLDAEQQRVCGAEALLRWHHPGRGNITPAVFVPIMEAAGITHEVSLWALNYALREVRSWRMAGFEHLRVAVNLSARDLEIETLPLLIKRTLLRHGLTPAALEVELTESVALADGEQAARLCTAMRSMGVAIAIDDFGTGYSSMAALRSLSFDKLKIDRSFVSGVDQQHDSQAICGAMLALGRGLGIQVLAEGVETAAEYAWLRAQGCRFFQGYHFARPLPSADFLALLRNPLNLAGIPTAAPPAAVPLERLDA